MATPPYVPLDPNGPNGPVQTPPQYSATDLANSRALRDMVVSGLGLQGWSSGQNTNNSIPDYYFWTDGAGRIIYAVVTYAGAPHYQPLTLQWKYTTDNGATQVNIGPLITFTFEPSNGTLWNINGMGGLFNQFMVSRARGVWNWQRADAHAAATGTAVHGLGTMALQPASGFNIDTGNIGNTWMNYCSAYRNNIIEAYRVTPYPTADLVNGAVWDWSVAGVQYRTFGGWSIPNLSNVVKGEIKRLWVSGAGAVTIGSGGSVTFVWATGHPVWSAGTGTLVSCCALDTGYVIGTTTPIP